jgi:hypothetical protein
MEILSQKQNINKRGGSSGGVLVWIQCPVRGESGGWGGKGDGQGEDEGEEEEEKDRDVGRAGGSGAALLYPALSQLWTGR